MPGSRSSSRRASATHGDRIRGEGFRFEALNWRRRGDRVVGAGRAVAAIAALYRRERPDIVHHVALKPVLFGGAALRLAFPRRAGRPCLRRRRQRARFGFLGLRASGAARLARARSLGRGGCAMPPATPASSCRTRRTGRRSPALGIDRSRLVLIRGSGVDTAHFAPLPEPLRIPGADVKVALVGRMLRSKGVLDAVAAVRRLRAEGLAVELVLAGPTDPDNPDSLDDRALAALAAEPGIVWLGRVEDVREVWAEAAIAVLPSTYGEGLPKSLLEAAVLRAARSSPATCRAAARSCGRASRAARPGCSSRRETSRRCPGRSRRWPATRSGGARWAGPGGVSSSASSPRSGSRRRRWRCTKRALRERGAAR